MTKNETMQKLIDLLRKDAADATALAGHCAEEAKKLQEHNAALAVSLQEFLYRVSGLCRSTKPNGCAILAKRF